jgi:hypothetical protein
MMNAEQIKDTLVAYNMQKGYKADNDTLLETLMEGEIIYKESLGDHRWWTEWFCVTKIKDVFIGYTWATTTGDNSIWDAGWEFDWDSLCEVEPKEVVTTIYIKKG